MRDSYLHRQRQSWFPAQGRDDGKRIFRRERNEARHENLRKHGQREPFLISFQCFVTTDVLPSKRVVSGPKRVVRRLKKVVTKPKVVTVPFSAFTLSRMG